MIKRILTPCSVHNTHKLELWLDEMSSEGFLLENEGFGVMYSKFRESEPQKTFHRIWPKDSINKFSDAKNRRKDFGWEFVASSTEYDIFRAYDEKALLIDYDKENNKFIEKASKRRILFQIISLFFSLLSLTIIAFLSPIISVAIPTGIFSVIILALITVSEIIKTAKNIFMISKIKRREYAKQTEIILNRKKDTVKYQVPNLIFIILLAIFLLIISYGKWTKPIAESLPDDKSSVPFATIIDFTDSKDSYASQNSILNKYEKWDTPLSVNNYEWTESAEILDKNGKKIRCTLFVDYHETIHSAIAKAVAKLYAIISRTAHDPFVSYADCPPYGFDCEIMYNREFGEPVYIFQNGCKIIKFNLSCYDDIPEDFNKRYIETVAESFRG